MAPVFSLVLDRDVDEDVALLYPELYKDLTKGRSLSTKTFLEWCLVSVFQGMALGLTAPPLQPSSTLTVVGVSQAARS
jgi:phospholipid-translocating ATPase